MPVELTWPDAAIRLALAIVAGIVIGYDRSERGRAAGLRTTLLVCLAAAVSMMQVNLLLPVAGKAPNSFVVMDLMRLPLGILTGMGFIGAGAILRRGDKVRGVTTAATLWMVTVIGLCFGGGQLALGLAAFGLCLAALWALKWLEYRMAIYRRASLMLICTTAGPTEDDVREALAIAGIHVESWQVTYRPAAVSPGHTIQCTLNVRSLAGETHRPEAINSLALRPGVTRLRWQM